MLVFIIMQQAAKQALKAIGCQYLIKVGWFFNAMAADQKTGIAERVAAMTATGTEANKVLLAERTDRQRAGMRVATDHTNSQ